MPYESTVEPTGLRRHSVIVGVLLAFGSLYVRGFGKDEAWGAPLALALFAVGLALIVAFAWTTRSAMWGWLIAYLLVIGIGSATSGIKDPPTLVRVALAATTILAGLGAMAVAIRAGRRQRELERLVFGESSEIAFFVIILASFTYALLESWLDFPELSMWIVWSFGMAVWGVTSVLVARRRS